MSNVSLLRRSTSFAWMTFLWIMSSCIQVQAQPIYNPANGHYYEEVPVNGGITWAEARDAAAQRTFSGLRGHLLTITSSAENAFVFAHLPSIPPNQQWHTGGYQDKTAPNFSEPTGGWRWVTGEAFQYTNWGAGEPNNALNYPPAEDWMILGPDGKWNDVPAQRPLGYLVEYDELTSAISGRITLQGAINQAQPLVFDFRPEGTTDVFRRPLTLNSDRTFTLGNLPRARYQIWIKGLRWLAKIISVDTTNGDVTNLRVTLPAGDANGDNSVDVFDLDALIQAFDSTPYDSNWIEGADLNADEIVDVLDLDLLILNFDQVGDI